MSFYHSSASIEKELPFCFLFWALSAAVKLSGNCSRECDEDNNNDKSTGTSAPNKAPSLI